jgi:high affinity sulfate transporter 1
VDRVAARERVFQIDRPPLFDSLHRYQRRWVRRDALAGLTVWAILVPEALAYASIAGVSPVVGLYAAPAALLLYAAFGSSKHLVAGPMSATAALSAAAVAGVATDGDFVALTATLAIVTGIIALVAGALRLGFLANFISEPVLKGFIIGLALTIIVGQLPTLFGVEKTAGNVFEKFWAFLGELGATSGLTLLVGTLSLAIVLVLRHVAPVAPASLAAVLFGIAAVRIFDVNANGVAIVGDVKSGLPTFGLPDVQAANYLALAPGAVGIMLVAFAEGLAAAKTYAALGHYEIDADRELVALGAANVGAGLSSGMVVGGSLSKTAVNVEGGARTQLSGLVAAGLTIVTLLYFTNLFADLPDATLAAVVIAALVELVDLRSIARLYRLATPQLARTYGIAARPDFVAGVAALIGVLVLDLLPGLFVGIAVSLLLLIYRASRPHIAVLGRVSEFEGLYADVGRHPSSTVVPGVTVLRVDGGLFFANADAVRSHIRAAASEPGIRGVVFDAEDVPLLDITAAHMLTEVATELEERGIRFLMARDIGAVEDVIRLSGGDEALRRVFPTVEAAVREIEQGTDTGRA